MKSVLGFLLSRWLLGTVAFLLFCFLVWVGGPIIHLGTTYAPLAGVEIRLTLILLVLAFIVGRLLWRHLKERNDAATIAALLQKMAERRPGNAEVDSERERIRERFSKAITQLKSFRGSGRPNQSPAGRLLDLASRQYLRRWPWYLVIGAPGSGKTYALRNAGLKFVLPDQFGDEVAGPEPTRYLDWMFTERAVFVDTAGRFTTQDSDPDKDRGGWELLLALFRKHRPINGVLVTVSVLELLGPEPKRRAVSDQIARRVQELYTTLGARIPIYVIVTKCDLLAGFVEFFRSYSKTHRAQVWGFTFPYADGEAGLFEPKSVRDEMKGLIDRLDGRLIKHMQGESDLRSRELQYLFPEQVAALVDPLAGFLEETFTSLALTETPLVRGVYLTSATQEQSPIDRVIGRLSNMMKTAPSASLPAQKPVAGRSYFLTHVLEKIVFPESTLRKTRLNWYRYGAWANSAAFVLLPLISIGLIAAWWNSYQANQHYLQKVSEKTVKIGQYLQAESGKTSRSPWTTVPILESARTLADTDGIRADHPPYSARLGLFQGEAIQDGARSLYRNLLEVLFLPRLNQLAASELQSHKGDPDTLFAPLKIYMMLHDKSHFDGDELEAWLNATWERQASKAGLESERGLLSRQVTAMKEAGIFQAPTVIDSALVRESQDTLVKSKTTAERQYQGLLGHISVPPANGVDLLRIVGGENAFLFVHADQQMFTTDIVDRKFTLEGYAQFRAATKELTQKSVQTTNWVLGTAADHGGDAGPEAIDSLRNQVLRLYLVAYAKAWQHFMDDVRLKPPHGLEESSKLAAKLAEKPSALRTLFAKVADETTLVNPSGKATAASDAIPSSVGKAIDTLQAVAGAGATSGSGEDALAKELVDDKFALMRRYVRGTGKDSPAPIDATIDHLRTIQEYFANAAASEKTGLKSEGSTETIKFGSHLDRDVPEPIKSMLKAFVQEGSRKVNRAMRDDAGNKFKADVGTWCAQVASAYPLNRRSQKDAQLDEFAQLFASAPKGKLETFFKDNLETIVDKRKDPWQFQSSDGSGASAALIQFQNAKAIREALLPNGSSVELSLNVEPGDADPAITQFTLNIDGTLLRASHGQSVPMRVTWPGPKGGTQVELQVASPSMQGGTKLYSGPWALYRALDEATKISNLPTGGGFFARFTVDGHWAEFKFLTGVRNPFYLPQMARFRCPNGF